MGCNVYCVNSSLTALAMVLRSRQVMPHAALISSHSTATLGKRPSLKPLTVPNGPSNHT